MSDIPRKENAIIYYWVKGQIFHLTFREHVYSFFNTCVKPK